MEDYKKSVESQHAPEALIARTLQRIHEEEQKMERTNVTPMQAQQPMQAQRPMQMQQPTQAQQSTYMQQPTYVQQPVKKTPKKSYRKWIGAVAGMAAGLVFIVGVGMMNSQSGLYYNSVPENIIREATQQDVWIEDTVDVETYSDYLGRDMSEVPEGMKLIQEDIYVRYDDMQSEIIEDEGTFYYNVNGDQIMVKVSRTLEVAPEELLAGEASEWDDMTVYAGKNETGNQLFAAVEQGDLQYFVMGLNMSEDEFEDFLEKYF